MTAGPHWGDGRGDGGMPQVDIATAARALGLSQGAVKKRLQRGTLPGGKDAAGRWYATLDAPEPSQDSRDDAGMTDRIPPGSRDQAALIDALQAEIASLRAALQRSQEGEAEQRRIIAGLVARVPELPSDRRPDLTGYDRTEAEPPPAARRPWWRFWR